MFGFLAVVLVSIVTVCAVLFGLVSTFENVEKEMEEN